MTLGTIALIVLVLLLIGAIPRWPHSRNWGYGPSGGVGCGASCGDSNAFAVQCNAASGTWVEGQSSCSGC